MHLAGEDACLPRLILHAPLNSTPARMSVVCRLLRERRRRWRGARLETGDRAKV
jgi:hypothetical protein